MDRFVWFVLLVVVSHLVTEFTRVTGYTRGPRQDVVMVNDSSIQPIRVQNQVLYPGQEYGPYEQQNQQYYNGNNLYNLYSNYANNNNYKNPSADANKSNFLSSLFRQFVKSNSNQNEQEQLHMSNNVNSNDLLNLPPKKFSLRPLIDSIFEIPISTLRAVNELMGRLTGGYLQPQQQQNHQQQPPTKYSSYPSYAPANLYYGMYRSADVIQPKTQFELLNKKRPTEETAGEAKPTVSSTSTSSTTTRRPATLNVGPQS